MVKFKVKFNLWRGFSIKWYEENKKSDKNYSKKFE